MSIFNETKQTEAQLIKGANYRAYMALRNDFERVFKMLNESKDIQAVLDDFGSDAIPLFQTSQKTIELLKFINPEYVPPISTNEFQFNADGTVTFISKPTE